MNKEQKKFREKTKKIAPNYDEALLAFETSLGMAAEMAAFIALTVKDFRIIPPNIQYAITSTSLFVLALSEPVECIPEIKKTDLSDTTDLNVKLKIILDYLEEIIKERNNDC